MLYADAIVRAGGVPVLLPPATDDPDAVAAVVRRLDGLVISGGADVDPAIYGEKPHEQTKSWRPDRDAWELALLTSAAAQNLPTLGVCRGMQVMAVATGGTLEQHTPDEVGHEQHSPGGDTFGDIEVKVDEASALHTILGPAVTVRCHHHQSVRSHPGYVATGARTGMLGSSPCSPPRLPRRRPAHARGVTRDAGDGRRDRRHPRAARPRPASATRAPQSWCRCVR